jgi:hypothetical protein
MNNQSIADISTFENLQSNQHERTGMSQMSVFNEVKDVVRAWKNIEKASKEYHRRDKEIELVEVEREKLRDKIAILRLKLSRHVNESRNADKILVDTLQSEMARISSLPEEEQQKEKAKLVAFTNTLKNNTRFRSAKFDAGYDW